MAPKNDGEALAWLAVYANTWTAICAQADIHGTSVIDSIVAAASAQQADRALAQLRLLAESGSLAARYVIDEES